MSWIDELLASVRDHHKGQAARWLSEQDHADLVRLLIGVADEAHIEAWARQYRRGACSGDEQLEVPF